MFDSEETIVAIASPTTPSIRGIVRLSGPDVASILKSLNVPIPVDKKPSRFDAEIELGEPLGSVPVAVMLWPTSRSYTGQPSAELHTFGSLPVLASLCQRVIQSGGRAARPGEFTMRAFLAGRLDLTQAEAVLGVIDARGRGSLDHALRQLGGNLSKPLEQTRSTLLDLLADVEAGLDFVDEDIEFISDEVLVQRLSELTVGLHQIGQQMTTRGGGGASSMIVLRGEPNAGKSRLINQLSAQDAAIVADVAGTTRDTVIVDAMIDGYAVKLVDTAGIEDGSDDISRLSQAQADRAGRDAMIRLWCVDRSRTDFSSAMDSVQSLASLTRRADTIDVWVATKADLGGPLIDDDWIQCSAVTGAGIERVRLAIVSVLASRDVEENGSVVGTAARCSQSLSSARSAIDNAIDLTRNQDGHELVSAELRIAAQSIGEVTGAIYTDDILDRVFGRFCIGK